MDEQRLSEMFRQAVGEPPPPSFGRAEVVAASRQITARRRGAVAGGSLIGVAMLTAGLLISGVLGADRTETATAHRASPHLGARSAAPELPRTLGTTLGSGVPAAGAEGSGRAGCAPRDDSLVTELTAVLASRGVAVAGPAGEVPGPCPPGSRAAAVPVPGGTLYVLVMPHAGAPELNDMVRPGGRREHALTLDPGRALVLISSPARTGQPAPLSGDVPGLTEELAGRLRGR